jgi:hypothetical protein
VTSTVDTGARVIVSVAELLFPSDVAVIVTTPGASADAIPDPLTVARLSLLLDHVVDRSASAF